MAQVKIESVKKKIEKEESLFLNDADVSNEIKANYSECNNNEEGLRKKYTYLAQWRAKKKREQYPTDKGSVADVTEIKSLFKELKNATDSNDKRIIDLINREIDNLTEYINTTEQRKKGAEKARLLREKEKIERLLAELN
jgi:hypothetical protein